MIRPSTPWPEDSGFQGSDDEVSVPLVPRLFLREPGWGVGLKRTSEREFCSSMAEGEDTYHRIGLGELYLFNHEERLCLPCADRRAFFQFEPKGLRASMPRHAITAEAGSGDTIPVVERDGVRPSDEFEPPGLREGRG